MSATALHGVNLSGWLTLESWVTPELFASSGALDEPALVQALGRKDYQEVVRRHRETFVTEGDFARIAARGFNAVRLPVPWYAFAEHEGDAGPYLPCAEQVDDALGWAEDIGLKVLFALRINPGAEVREGSSLHTLADLGAYRSRALDAVDALSSRYASRIGFFGIAVADDVVPQGRRGLVLTDGVPPHVLRNYYREAYEIVRANAGEDVVFVMPDGGRPDLWMRFMAQRRYVNTWLDCHLTCADTTLDATGPDGVRMLLDRSRRHLAEARRSGMPVMVGKWSSALPVSDSLMTPEGRMALERIFASEQLALYRSCPAWFFETWKTTGHLASWDARVALSSFERGMISR